MAFLTPFNLPTFHPFRIKIWKAESRLFQNSPEFLTQSVESSGFLFYCNRKTKLSKKPTQTSQLYFFENSFPYYKYCIDNGGETAIKKSAKTALQRIQ